MENEEKQKCLCDRRFEKIEMDFVKMKLTPFGHDWHC